MFNYLSSPHLMPLLVLDRIMIREITDRTMGASVALALAKNIKRPWSSFLIRIGHYALMNFLYEVNKVDSIKELKFLMGIFRNHDPNGVVKENFKYVNLTYPYEHESSPNDSVFEDVLMHEESKLTKRITRFCPYLVPRSITKRKTKGAMIF